jgi:hypothetical protein
MLTKQILHLYHLSQNNTAKILEYQIQLMVYKSLILSMKEREVMINFSH